MKKNIFRIILLNATVVVMCVLGAALYFNKVNYDEWNKTLNAVGLDTYHEDNAIVKTETLEQMEQEVIDELTNDVTDYKTRFGTEDNTRESAIAIKDDETLSDYGKVTKIENLLWTNGKKHVEVEYTAELAKVKNTSKFTKEEQAKYNELKKQVENLPVEITTYEDVKAYDDQVSEYSSSVAALNKEVSTRLKKEEEKKEEEERIAAEEEAAKVEEERIAAEQEAQEAASAQTTSDFSEYSASSSGEYNRAAAQGIFDATNAYRAGLGLPPYTYNSSKQSCVDSEAYAYGQNKNPHNWVCDVANENASYVGVGQDVVGISMDFFISSPSHEAVLSGDYNSATASCYVKDGMNHCILSVFY